MSQREELLSFVREGKGFVAAHVGLTAFESWPEFLDLLGARFDGHPINGPGTVVNERPDFPATKHFPASFAFTDEFYQPKDHSREKIDVLLRALTLLPGDVISTGTPAGVAMGHKPVRFLQPGDVVELGIDGLGSSRQRLRAYA